MDNDTPRDLTDMALEVMIDLEFIRSNPSPEVMRQYGMDMLRQSAHRAARANLARMRREVRDNADTVAVRHIDWP